MKFCNKCSTEKSAEFFYKDVNKVDGLQTVCSTCVMTRIRKHQLNVSVSDRREYYRQRYSDNKKVRAHMIAKAALRRAKKLQATPKWANIDSIKEIYQNCPDGYHVDHVIPLQGENVTGLHVEYNLQYLLAIDNFRKSNKVVA